MKAHIQLIAELNLISKYLTFLFSTTPDSVH